MKTATFDAGGPPPCPTPFNLSQYVLAKGRETPNKIALSVLSLSGAERWSYAALTRAVEGTAQGLLRQGLAPGDRVVMRLGNSVAFPVTYLAAIAMGAIPVPTSSQLTEPEVAQIIDEVAPTLVVAEASLPCPRTEVPIVDAAKLPEFFDLPPAAFALGDPNRPAYIIYTSGTSGRPRAVTHAHRAIWARQMMWQDWYGLRPTDRLLHAGAFNWTYTLGTGLLDPWSLGATALIPGPDVGPEHLPLLLKRHDATIFAAAPGVYRRLLRHPVPSLPKLRHGLSAGEKLADQTRRAWQEKTGTDIYEAFGLSECSTFISSNPNAPAEPGTIGRPQTGRRVAVLRDGAPVAPQTPGVLAVSTSDPGLMLGYWDPATGGPARLDGAWFETGDIMSMSPSGDLTYLGRNDDMMNAGGIRVSPLEVEAVVTNHPQVTDCAVVEQKIAPDTSIIAAFYVASEDVPDLEIFTAQSLARYKVPRRFVRCDALPKNANGKVLRAKLRQSTNQT